MGPSDHVFDAPSIPKNPWKKLLYLRQEEYPDNYVDHSFLEKLQKNVNVRRYSYIPLIIYPCHLIIHANIILLFVGLFIFLYSEMIKNNLLLLFFNHGAALAGFIFWSLLDVASVSPAFTNICSPSFWCHINLVHSFNCFKRSFLFFFILLGLSPILKTLTKDTSCDTIWAVSTILFLINLGFHDHSFASIDRKSESMIALNAGIFASALLASRLKSNDQVFGLVSSAVLLFALIPRLLRMVRVCYYF
ncbi:hypothetical protein DI09_170p40 [Mitosporidium daphniae]|uniref:Phosphatidylinositol N-acetylglucosaminyltransferase n=1 Tax=Mitosporidium daphniae TaxID=1485682 RepID=A0A098VU32_9MICR|nr:uncharacterized protein DI09_170p40 [Mitosporidium daphniae]KGG52445.1 hypothetical protein DI09_170p40 [Mitosporidium daphniae]|eukprot:XP_013238881.1 uncharacterized protein DI09_170p40 [Mitosporidium daphniae]